MSAIHSSHLLGPGFECYQCGKHGSLLDHGEPCPHPNPLAEEVQKLTARIAELEAEVGKREAWIATLEQDIRNLRILNDALSDCSTMSEERTARLRSAAEKAREALKETLVPGREGGTGLHDPGCPGVYGYRCKGWCGSTAAVIAALDEALGKGEG